VEEAWRIKVAQADADRELQEEGARMTQDIIEMARQAELAYDIDAVFTFKGNFAQIEAFAKLVAAKEQEAIIDLVAFYGGSVDLEAAIRARGEA
jgi:hypothetical protein